MNSQINKVINKSSFIKKNLNSIQKSENDEGEEYMPVYHVDTPKPLKTGKYKGSMLVNGKESFPLLDGKGKLQ
jgi:hypothetical protein